MTYLPRLHPFLIGLTIALAGFSPIARSELVAQPATGPAIAAAAGEIDRTALIQDLDSIARSPVLAGRSLGISVAVVQGGDTLLLRDYGRADLGSDAPIPADAEHEIASVTKQFTAAAILQLAEQGRVDLDDEITRYLPDYPAPAPGVTIRRLLDHTAGIHGISFQVPRYQQLAMRSLPLDSIVALFASEPLDFSPGEAMIYSNSGYILAGLIIERVSGVPYAEYIERMIFEPLGMAGSYACRRGVTGGRRVKGYAAQSSGGFAGAPEFDYAWVYAAGSLCSTAGDLVTWLQALHGGRVLGEAAYRELTTPAVLPHGHRLRYAKGLEVKEDASGHLRIGHGGALPGSMAEVRYYPGSDLSVIVLTNTAGPPGAEAIADALARRVLGPGPRPQPVPYPADLDVLVGRYSGAARNEPLTILVERSGEGIAVRVGENGRPIPIAYIGGNTFATGSARFIFEVEGGHVAALHFDPAGNPGHFVLARHD